MFFRTMLHIQHIHTNCPHTLTQTPGLVAPSTRIPRHRHLTGRAGRTGTPCHSPHSQVCTCTSPHVHQNSHQYKSSPNFHVLFHTDTHEWVTIASHLCLRHLPSLQERGRSACSSSCSRCSRRHRCGAASGGSSPPPARSSSPPRTRSAWRSCGGGERATARPWPTKRWHGRWGTTPAQGRSRRWRGSSRTALMRRHWEAYKETQCREHEGEFI